MSKFNGLKLTSFILGVCLPLGVCCYLISVVLNLKPDVVIVPTEEPIVLAESYVDIFSVDYDMYGKYELGNDKIVGEVYNNSSNTYDCNVWLEDSDNAVITDVVELKPSERSIVFMSNRVWKETGKYDVKLVYEVLIGIYSARIECSYVVLVNGGL